MLKRKVPNLPRQMWTKEGDDLLRKIVETNYNLPWNEVANMLNESNPKMKKSGKQCRERYKNYLDPNITNRSWSKDEKILFILLHSKYVNRWGKIAKFYPNRNDISMKNYFYSYMRKSLKKIRCKTSSISTIYSSWKLIELYYILELIHKKYIPRIQKENDINLSFCKDKTIMNVITKSGIDENILTKYKTKLTQRFKDITKSPTLPLTVRLNSEKFNWNTSERKLIEEVIKEQNFGDLSHLVILKATSSLKGHSVHAPEPSLKKQNNIAKPVSQFPDSSPLKPFYYSVVNSPIHIMVPSSKALVHTDEKTPEISQRTQSQPLKDFNSVPQAYQPINFFPYCPGISPIRIESIIPSVQPLYFPYSFAGHQAFMTSPQVYQYSKVEKQQTGFRESSYNVEKSSLKEMEDSPGKNSKSLEMSEEREYSDEAE